MIVVSNMGYNISLAFTVRSAVKMTTMPASVFWFQVLVIVSSFYSFGFFLDSVHRMNQITKNFPVFKRSEKFYHCTMAFFGIVNLLVLTTFIVTLVYVQRGGSNDKLLFKTILVLNVLTILGGQVFNLLVCFIVLRLNKPLATWKDLESGQNMSMLMFIRSYNMRQVLGDATDSVAEEQSERTTVGRNSPYDPTAKSHRQSELNKFGQTSQSSLN
jgi:hypothetical protein